MRPLEEDSGLELAKRKSQKLEKGMRITGYQGDIDPVNSYFRVERALTNKKRTSACVARAARPG
jgi:hypothetical protein